MRIRPLLLLLIAGHFSLNAIWAGEVVLSGHRLALTLPESWKQATNQPAAVLCRADSDDGQMSVLLVRPELPKDLDQEQMKVKDADFQRGAQDSLRDQGFPKLVRSQIVKIAGSDAYLCEATRNDGHPSVLHVLWFHEERMHVLLFVSKSKPLKDVADVQTIIDSIKVLPKK